jgi:V/A-type H+-transporting ATPase subunit B
MTHQDHPALSAQLYAAYAQAREARVLASVVGEEGLAEIDRAFIRFGDLFEEELVNQDSPRTLQESLGLGWKVLQALPRTELHRLSDEQIARNLEPERAR